MPRRFIFELPDGSVELHYRKERPTVGVTVVVLGREFVVVSIDESDRCTLEPVDGQRANGADDGAGGSPVPGRVAGRSLPA